MKLCGGTQPHQLLQMLSSTLQRQADKWISCVYNKPVNKEVEVSPEQRDEIVRWMSQLNRKFGFYPETLMLAVAILDKFLHSVKVRPKYLRCVGITCFYLAAKTCEEDEVIPATSELVEESECGRTVSEVLRMERVILDKLGWDLNLATPLDFIHIFHALLISRMPHLLDNRSMTPSRQLAILTAKLTHCVEKHDLIGTIPPSLLAAALISLELETSFPDWLAATLWIQSLAQSDNSDIIRYRERISSYLSTGSGSNQLLKNLMLPSGINPPLAYTSSTKRKVEQMDIDEEDNIYDGIKQLYSMEESDTIKSSLCGREASDRGLLSPTMTALTAN